MAKKRKRKATSYELVPLKEGREVSEPYQLLAQLVDGPHTRLEEAKIVLVWRKEWKPNRDGLTILGKCKKASELDRNLREHDFVILLNKSAWQHLSVAQRTALLDHELCHAVIELDDDGEPKRDDRGRLCCRVRKHDLEEFREVVERNGCYLADIVEFIQAATAKGPPTLPFPAEESA